MLPYCRKVVDTETTLGVYGWDGEDVNQCALGPTATTTIHFTPNVPFTLLKPAVASQSAKFLSFSTSAATLVHWVIQLQSQNPDLSLLDSGITTVASTNTRPQALPTIERNIPALSIGAKVGIGVSAGIAGLLALILLGVLFRWRRQRHLARSIQTSNLRPDIDPATAY